MSLDFNIFKFVFHEKKIMSILSDPSCFWTYLSVGMIYYVNFQNITFFLKTIQPKEEKNKGFRDFG